GLTGRDRSSPPRSLAGRDAEMTHLHDESAAAPWTASAIAPAATPPPRLPTRNLINGSSTADQDATIRSVNQLPCDGPLNSGFVRAAQARGVRVRDAASRGCSARHRCAARVRGDGG